MGSEFAGKRVMVMGLGRFGGGIAVTRWLCEQGAEVHVTDLASQDALAGSLDALKGLSYTTRLGGHDLADLDRCDLLVVNPAVDKARSSFFKAAIARGMAWSSEMNLFLVRCRGRVVGITGTVGKSTTTAMTGAVLEKASSSPSWKHGKVWVGGNIGKSLLDCLPTIQPNDVVVLELSSFQLEDAERIRKSPHIAVVTNLKENHLDRHVTMEAYAAAKSNIYKFQTADDWLIVPFDGGCDRMPGAWASRPNLVRFGVDADTREVRLEVPEGGRRVERRAELPVSLPGLHNVQNAAVALVVARILGVPDETTRQALHEFKGLAHRLEFVRDYRGVKYYNDSKATTPEAAMTSLAAFSGGVIMLVGGSDKGIAFTELGRQLFRRAKAVICMGDTREKIFAATAEARAGSDRPALHRADSFETAMKLARDLATTGDVVLLSPGCASYDWFTNYEVRGEMFKRIVQGWE